MRITVLTTGSRGDVEPYVALAVGLKNHSHTVRVAANLNFKSLVDSYGLEFHPLNVDSFKFVQTQQAQAWLESGSALALAINSVRVVRPVLDQIHLDAWDACQDAEAIIYHSFTMPTGYFMGKSMGVPSLAASIYPVATRQHPALSLNISRQLGGRINLLSHWMVNQFTWLAYRKSASKLWSERLEMPVSNPYRLLTKGQLPIVCCYSPVVSPKPADLPSNVHVVGYWLLDPAADWRPEPALLKFLSSGPAPIFVGFASMGNPSKARDTTAIILKALELTGHRGVLVAGWSGLGSDLPLSKSVLALTGVPYGWLFPRMSVIVHHGGAGTTGFALRAGAPNVVIPHFADNHFWARRIHELGLGPEPIPRRKLTAENLAHAIDEAVRSPWIRERAQVIGRQIRAEDGVGQAIRILHNAFERRSTC